MKTAVALAIGLASSAVPIGAQDRTVTTPGPIARTAAREAARLGKAHQVAQPSDSDWARVQKLAPGAVVTLTVSGSQPGARYVVSFNEHELTVLNLSNSAVPPAAKAVLLDVASHHPAYFEATRAGDKFVLRKNVRMGPDGVFVADRKVADLAQVVERIMRADVLEIRGFQGARGSVIGAIAGAAAGLMLGRLFAANLVFKQCGGGCGDEEALIGLSLVGLPVAGGILGYSALGRKTADVIYRAP